MSNAQKGCAYYHKNLTRGDNYSALTRISGDSLFPPAVHSCTRLTGRPVRVCASVNAASCVCVLLSKQLPAWGTFPSAGNWVIWPAELIWLSCCCFIQDCYTMLDFLSGCVPVQCPDAPVNASWRVIDVCPIWNASEERGSEFWHYQWIPLN